MGLPRSTHPPIRDLDAVFPPEGRHSRGLRLSYPSCPRAVLAQACQPLWLVLHDDGYDDSPGFILSRSRIPPPETGRFEFPLRFILMVVYFRPRATLSRRLRTRGLLPMHAPVGFRGETRTAVVYLLENTAEVNVRLRVAPRRSSGPLLTSRPLSLHVRARH